MPDLIHPRTPLDDRLLRILADLDLDVRDLLMTLAIGIAAQLRARNWSGTGASYEMAEHLDDYEIAHLALGRDLNWREGRAFEKTIRAALDEKLAAAPPKRHGYTFTLPTIHGNGDRKETLVDVHSEAHRALRAACEALAKCGPNDRNFYPQGPEACSRAHAEHEGRQARLGALCEEIGALKLAISRL